MVPAPEYDIAGVEFTDDRYTVEQSLVRNKYRAVDAAGDTVLRGKQKLFKLKEEFPFADADGNDVFTVKASGIIDVAGDYLLTDARTGDDLVVLDNDFSVFRDTWTIRDAETGERLATIASRGALATLARNLLPFGGWIPHEYEITDADGAHVGGIRGQFSLRDRYEITIDDASAVPREPIVAAAMVIDAIQGN
ncbi:MAG: LURP-one-related/scramblase family protein [Haloferacaceae archaeon]